MPVLVTISTLTYLFFGGSRAKPSLLAPAALRKRIEKLPEGPSRTEALAIVDDLDALAREYDEATDRTIDAYRADVVRWDSSADALIDAFAGDDQIRGRVLRDLVPLRQRLLDTLSAQEWDVVFG